MTKPLSLPFASDAGSIRPEYSRSAARVPPRTSGETAYERGWDTLANGELLKIAENAGFHVFVTPDKNIRYQQNLRERTIAIVVVANPQWPALRLHVERVAAAVNCAKPGSYTEVQIPEAR